MSANWSNRTSDEISKCERQYSLGVLNNYLQWILFLSVYLSFLNFLPYNWGLFMIAFLNCPWLVYSTPSINHNLPFGVVPWDAQNSALQRLAWFMDYWLLFYNSQKLSWNRLLAFVQINVGGFICLCWPHLGILWQYLCASTPNYENNISKFLAVQQALMLDMHWFV